MVKKRNGDKESVHVHKCVEEEISNRRHPPPTFLSGHIPPFLFIAVFLLNQGAPVLTFAKSVNKIFTPFFNQSVTPHCAEQWRQSWIILKNALFTTYLVRIKKALTFVKLQMQILSACWVSPKTNDIEFPRYWYCPTRRWRRAEWSGWRGPCESRWTDLKL